jgi:hypothetical protein
MTLRASGRGHIIAAGAGCTKRGPRLQKGLAEDLYHTNANVWLGSHANFPLQRPDDKLEPGVRTTSTARTLKS